MTIMYWEGCCFCHLHPQDLFSPYQGEPLFLWQVVDGDLFQQRSPLRRPHHIYLESHLDLLGQGAVRENGLHLRNHCAVDHTA